MAIFDRFGILSPLSNQPPAANFATIDTRNSTPVLDFDAAINESAIWSFPPPATLTTNTGLEIKLLCAMSTATSGSVVIQAEVERQNFDVASIASDGFGTGDSSITSVPSTAGILFRVIITLSNIRVDGLTAADFFRIRLTRLATDASDTATGDLELVYGLVEEAG